MNKSIKIILYIVLILIFSSSLFVIFNSSKPKNIVILEFGMGNQMFQYAYGKALEKSTGQKVLYYKSFPFERKRKYALGIFKLNIHFATDEEIESNQPFIQEEHPNILIEKLLNSKIVGTYRGYFQNEKYFENVASEIRKDFTFPKIGKYDAWNQYWLKKIKEAENPVFIHIRRGDYLGYKWELPANYYKEAIKYIQNNVKNPTFFIFGIDSDQFIYNTLKLDIPYYKVGNENNLLNEDWKDMMLMSHCKHAIIANSTFSWWAAWLGPNQTGGIVVAPSPFLNGQDDTVCDNWIKIKYQNL